MNRKCVSVFALIYLFIQPLYSMQEITLQEITFGSEVAEVGSINFVKGGGVVLSVFEHIKLTNFDRRKYMHIKMCCEKNKDNEQIILHQKKKFVLDRKIGNYAINGQGTKIAILESGCLIVYNIQQKKQEWNKKVHYASEALSVTFNPENDEEIIFYDHYTETFNIHSQQLHNTMLATLGIDFSPISEKTFCLFHPTKTEFILNFNSLYYYHGDYRNNSYKRYEFNFLPMQHSIASQRYNADGTNMAAMSCAKKDQLFFMVPGSTDYSATPLQDRSFTSCVGMCFHPNNKVVYILENKNYDLGVVCSFLYSYNTQTGKLINRHELDNNSEGEGISEYTNQRIAVSADGRKIGIALKKRCVLLSTLYMLLGTKEISELSQKMHLLKWYAQQGQNQENGLPSDVMDLIIKQFLDLHYE